MNGATANHTAIFRESGSLSRKASRRKNAAHKPDSARYSLFSIDFIVTLPRLGRESILPYPSPRDSKRGQGGEGISKQGKQKWTPRNDWEGSKKGSTVFAMFSWIMDSRGYSQSMIPA